jgi:hypothetical protein
MGLSDPALGFPHSPMTIRHSPTPKKKAPPDGPDEASLFLAAHCFLIAAHLSHLVAGWI